MAPLWEALWETPHVLMPPSPNTPYMPARWACRTIRSYLMQSGQLISAEESDRRVLVLENPGFKGHLCITQSMHASLQVILPGEGAPSRTEPTC